MNLISYLLIKNLDDLKKWYNQWIKFRNSRRNFDLMILKEFVPECSLFIERFQKIIFNYIFKDYSNIYYGFPLCFAFSAFQFF